MECLTTNSPRSSSASTSKMYRSGLVKPVSSRPAGRSTRKHSRQTGARSGQNVFDTGLKTRSKLESAKALRSRMSPSTVLIVRPSLAATSSSRPSCRGELSNTVTSAPAAARTGPCWPPPEARQSTAAPARPTGNQSRGTGSYPMRTTDQSPDLAREMTSGPTGAVHSLPRSTSRSQAARLYATGSKFSVTAARLAPGGTASGSGPFVSYFIWACLATGRPPGCAGRPRTPRFRRSGPNPGEAGRTGRWAASGSARRRRPATRLFRQARELRRRAGSRRRATPATRAAGPPRDRQARNPCPSFSHARLFRGSLLPRGGRAASPKHRWPIGVVHRDASRRWNPPRARKITCEAPSSTN
jgi:hypothetical protein